MTNEELRKSICASLKMADRRTLKMIKALVEEYYAPDDEEDENSLYEKLEKRSKAYRSGKMKTIAVADAIVKYRTKNKKK